MSKVVAGKELSIEVVQVMNRYAGKQKKRCIHKAKTNTKSTNTKNQRSALSSPQPGPSAYLIIAVMKKLMTLHFPANAKGSL